MEKKLTAEEITEFRVKDIPSIPGTGSKYFEPNASVEESSEIRSHLNSVRELISFEKIRKLGSLSQAVWHSDLQKAEVVHQVGSHWTTMGHLLDKKLYLFPEEALYLLEMGALEISYNNVILSIQRAYSALLAPSTDVPIECYRVYSQLNANGFKVLRHITSNVLTKYEKQIEMHKAGIKVKTCSSSSSSSGKIPDVITTASGMSAEREPEKEPRCRNVADIFPSNPEDEDGKNACLEALRIFDGYQDSAKSNLNVQYDIYLPNSFKKSYIQLPRFRIVVHRGNDPMPDWEEFYRLTRQFEDEVPILHAIVFPEFISFYSISPVKTPVCE